MLLLVLFNRYQIGQILLLHVLIIALMHGVGLSRKIKGDPGLLSLCLFHYLLLLIDDFRLHCVLTCAAGAAYGATDSV